MAYIPAVVRIPYHHPGSTDLAEDVSSNLDMGEVGLLSNHGVIVAAASLEEAVLKTETMELMCRILYLARAASMKLEYLPDAVRDDFLAHLAHIRGYGKSHAG
jgi:L-fuculose-phosphate aldolase